MSDDNEITRNRIPWKVPSTWVWTQFGEIAEVVSGGPPPTNDPTNYEDGEIPWVTPADLSGYTAKLIKQGSRHITPKGLAASNARLIPAGSLLFSSRAPIGYVAIAANPLSTNQGFKSFVLPQCISPDYGYYYLQRAREIAISMASGTTFPELSSTKAKQVPLPLAPENEQRRIVSEIEKQLTRLDVGLHALRRLQYKLKHYRASVLKTACEGRLVPTESQLALQAGRNYEPADELLSQILEERRTAWEADQTNKDRAIPKKRRPGSKLRYPEPPSPQSPSINLPEGWTYATIGQLAPLQPGYAFPSAHFKEKGIRLLKGINVRDGWLSEEEVDFWSPDQSADFGHLRLSEGDIVLAMDRPVYSSGSKAVKLATLSKAWDGALLLQRVGRFRIVDPRLRPFILLFLQSEFFRSHLISSQNGSQDGKDLPHVSTGVVDATCVPLPPLEEQRRIVAEASKQLSNIRELELAIGVGLKRSALLRKSILKRAFEGQLVAQDPRDEPATLLLERIKSSRSSPAQEAASKKVAARRKKAS